jgi:hypothetical protein
LIALVDIARAPASNCNCWDHPGEDKLIMKRMESDLEALRGAEVRAAKTISSSVPGIGFGHRPTQQGLKFVMLGQL